LGTASAQELSASLSILTANELELLRGLGVFVGHLSVFIDSTLRRVGLEQRATFCSAFEPELVLPPPGQTNYETRSLSPSVWRRLGYIDLGPRACRVDLAERAAQAFFAGASESDALRCLSIPRRDAARVARALREASRPLPDAVGAA
jgi:hypothetical protein